METSATDWVSDEYDRDWHQYATLTFQLNPDLKETTKQAMREDYQFQHDVLNIQCRKAVSLYVQRQMFQVDQQTNSVIWLESNLDHNASLGL